MMCRRRRRLCTAANAREVAAANIATIAQSRHYTQKLSLLLVLLVVYCLLSVDLYMFDM